MWLSSVAAWLAMTRLIALIFVVVVVACGLPRHSSSGSFSHASSNSFEVHHLFGFIDLRRCSDLVQASFFSFFIPAFLWDESSSSGH